MGMDNFKGLTAAAAAAAAKSLQSCPTLCDPIDGSPPGSPVPGILQARTLERVAISFSSAWKWKEKVKSLSPDPQRPHRLQPTRLLCPWDFPGKSTGVGCHCLLRKVSLYITKLLSKMIEAIYIPTNSYKSAQIKYIYSKLLITWLLQLLSCICAVNLLSE